MDVASPRGVNCLGETGKGVRRRGLDRTEGLDQPVADADEPSSFLTPRSRQSDLHAVHIGHGNWFLGAPACLYAGSDSHRHSSDSGSGALHQSTSSTANGIIFYHDGSAYVGCVTRGLRDGEGTLLHAATDVQYDGGWRQDLWHGKGRLYSIHDKCILTGLWEKGELSGKGVRLDLTTGLTWLERYSDGHLTSSELVRLLDKDNDDASSDTNTDGDVDGEFDGGANGVVDGEVGGEQVKADCKEPEPSSSTFQVAGSPLWQRYLPRDRSLPPLSEERLAYRVAELKYCREKDEISKNLRRAKESPAKESPAKESPAKDSLAKDSLAKDSPMHESSPPSPRAFDAFDQHWHDLGHSHRDAIAEGTGEHELLWQQFRDAWIPFENIRIEEWLCSCGIKSKLTPETEIGICTSAGSQGGVKSIESNPEWCDCDSSTFRASWSGRSVAVKAFTGRLVDPLAWIEYIIFTLTIRNEHVVRSLGHSFDGPFRHFIIVEFVPFRSVLDALLWSNGGGKKDEKAAGPKELTRRAIEEAIDGVALGSQTAFIDLPFKFHTKHLSQTLHNYTPCTPKTMSHKVMKGAFLERLKIRGIGRERTTTTSRDRSEFMGRNETGETGSTMALAPACEFQDDADAALMVGKLEFPLTTAHCSHSHHYLQSLFPKPKIRGKYSRPNSDSNTRSPIVEQAENTIRYYPLQNSSDASLARIGRAIVAGLVYLHDRGVRHSNLKPSNVLLDESGCPKLTDYGLKSLLNAFAPAPLLACLPGRTGEKGGMRDGLGRSGVKTSVTCPQCHEQLSEVRHSEARSPPIIPTMRRPRKLNWAAPEVLRPPLNFLGHEVCTDVHGVGMILWSLFRQQIPFAPFSQTQIRAAVGYGGVKPFMTPLPPPIASLVRKCLDLDCANRPSLPLLHHVLSNVDEVVTSAASRALVVFMQGPSDVTLPTK